MTVDDVTFIYRGLMGITSIVAPIVGRAMANRKERKR